MSIFRVAKSPYYQFDFQIQGYRFSGSTKCRNERDAKEFEKARRAEAERLVKDGLSSGKRPLTLGHACDRWWEEFGAHGKDPDIRRALDWLKEQIGPATSLHDITDEIVSRAVEARRKMTKRAGRDSDGKQLYRQVSARTVNKTVTSLLSRVLHRARDNWGALLPYEPRWNKHKLKETKRPVREITSAEDAALDAVECEDYRDLRRFAEITGLRRRELLLTWPQVDFEAALVRVIAKGGTPKTIPLSREAYAMLWARKGQHPTSVFTFIAQRTRRCSKTGTKFVKGWRYPMTYYGIGTNRRRKWAKAGVDARLHDTRHTTGMRTLRATGNLKLVQRLLGHKKITTTADFYTDANLDDIRRGMEDTREHIESQKNPQTGAAEFHKHMKNNNNNPKG